MTANARKCWCGHAVLEPYSNEYDVCKACGTLVSRAPLQSSPIAIAQDAGELYSKNYWLERQREHHELPDIHARARLDLPERCVHWLQHLLNLCLPPARVLEIGCGHGGYVALLNWAGFSATGTELSPWVVEFARQTFHVEVTAGPIEAQTFAPHSFDVLVLNDVIEHLADPLATLSAAAKLLKPNGFFVIQTPEYKEHLSYAEIVSSGDLFLKHMEHNNDEHLYLFSRRSVSALFARLGFPTLVFASPVYSYDMYFTASQAPLPTYSKDAIAEVLKQTPTARLVLALLDKAFESTDRSWAIRRLETELRELKSRL